MNFGICWCMAALVVSSSARWQWPEPASSVRIDTKVRFIDHGGDSEGGGTRVQADEAPFQEAAQTDGFYNRPRGAGRYPVRVERPRLAPPYIHPPRSLPANYNSDGTLDSLQYCKCSPAANCNVQHDSAGACGQGKFLCCSRRPNKFNPPNTEYFNEIDDERPSLLPGSEGPARPFPPAPTHADLGPEYQHEVNPGRAVLVGPAGPSGVIGPAAHNAPPKNNPDVLVGPGGPTGTIGPAAPAQNGGRDVGPSESAQRGILVGPGGPTGIIGPRGYAQRPVLVGPGGPTGIIGPRMRGFFNQYYGGQPAPGVLVGPGGPTGGIGPGRSVLVGPGGPTGRIGPQNYFG